MRISKERVMVRTGREAGSMILHAVLLAGFTLVFHHLIGDPDWTPSALAAFLLAYPIRYAVSIRLHASSPAFSWNGWIWADLLFFGIMGWKFDVFEGGGIVLAGLILMPAALFVSPMIMARFNAGVLFVYILLLNAQEGGLDTPDVWISDILCLLLFAVASLLVSASRMRSHADRSAFREVALDVFERLNLNLAVLDEEGRFVVANSRALKTLERGANELAGLKCSDLIYKSMLLGQFERHGALSGILIRLDGSLSPVAYEIVPLPLQGDILGHGRPNKLMDYQLLVFTDISDLIEGQDALNRQKRNQTVNNMLEVFSDGVRNPLAGISAYVQVLLRKEEKTSGGEDSEQMKIYRQMVEDIEDLDSLLEELMTNSRLTPEEAEKHFANLKAKRQKDLEDGPKNGRVGGES